MHVEKTTTGVILKNPTDKIKEKCDQYFSLKNPIREFFIYEKTRSAIFDSPEETIHITSGFLKINDAVIKKLNVSDKSIIVGKDVTIEMNREPRSELQRDCIQFITTTKSDKITIELKPGTGKAHPYSTKIPSPVSEGYILMKDIKIGDVVFDRTGKYTNVIGTFEQGIQQVYKITFQDGRVSYCTLDHLWYVKYRNGVHETLTLGDIINKPGNYYIPLCEPVQYEERPIPMNPWVVGCFIHNLHLDENNRCLQITSKNSYVPSIIAKLYGFNFRPSGKNLYSFYQQSGQRIDVDDFFKCLPEILNNDKTIPTDYMFNSIPNRKRLLKGITDSNPNHGTDIFKDDNALRLIYSLGITHIYGRELLGMDPEKGLLIKSIQLSHQEECKCIMVDNYERLYLTEDYIVTHNTFISLYSIAKMGLKPLIVTPTTLLKNQWIDNLIDIGIDEDDIATTIKDSIGKTFCVVTITALENEMRNDFMTLNKIINDARFGIKIIDEAHLHLKGILKLDSLCNIKNNWYLSATLGRSDYAEDRILNRSLLDAERFVGNSNYDEYQKKFVNIYLQNIYYFPSASLCNKYFRYGAKGLVRSTYYNMLMNYRGGKPFINNIIKVIKRAKDVIPTGKILILVPLINTINAVVDVVKTDPYFSKMSIAGIDGTLPLSEKRRAMENDIIISTAMSMGVGVDIMNLSTVVNFDQYASPIITEQIIGRLRDRGEETYYFDICDNVNYAKVIAGWGKKRRVLFPFFPGIKPEMKKLPDIIS